MAEHEKQKALETLVKYSFANNVTTGKEGGQEAYNTYLKKMRKDYPKVFAGMQEDNTAATLAMLDEIQFYGLDRYKKDERSVTGMKDMEFSSRIPMGSSTSPIIFNRDGRDIPVAGYTLNTGEENRNGQPLYFEGNADPSTYRHEAWHRGGPDMNYAEYINRRMDYKYAKENGDQATMDNTQTFLDRLNITPEAKTAGDNYVDYGAPSRAGQIQNLGSTFRRWMDN